MSAEMTLLAAASREKTLKALVLLEASLSDYLPYEAKRVYTPKQLEPYDALSDRFVRAVETSIKFFRTYERLMFAEYSDTLRDLLNRMHKLDLISGVEMWIELRDVRNRVVHDYLPEQLESLYALMTGPFADELMALRDKLVRLTLSGS
jgi:hypothetical protein